MTLKLHKSKKTGRNEKCPCDSGLKFKHCHDDEKKKVICMQIANQAMAALIFQERIEKGLICQHGVEINEHCKKCKIGD